MYDLIFFLTLMLSVTFLLLILFLYRFKHSNL